MIQYQQLPNLFETEQKCNCLRCGARCRLDPIVNSKARMVKRSDVPKGLCINCAVHDTLRNLYPANMLLASSGPRGLAFPHIQEQFAGILKSANSDAMPGEINWDIVIKNWDLPFPHKLKRSATNPVDHAELDRAPQEEIRRRKFIDERLKDPRSDEEISDDNYKKAEALLFNAMRKRDEDI